MLNIYYIFYHPINNWILKKADSINFIRRDSSKPELISFACSVCGKENSELVVFDIDGEVSDRICFSN